MARPAAVRFYFDEDLLGLAHVICRLRFDCTYPGDPGAEIQKRLRPPCPISRRGVPDSEWIPVVSERDWIVVTRDRNIQVNRQEINAVRDHGARMITISGREGTSKWTQLEILMCQWRAIDALGTEPGPFIYTATRTSLKMVDLNA